MVVSTSFGTARDLSEAPRPRDIRLARCSALARVDLDPVAHVHEQRHLHDRARLERRRLRHVRDRVARTPGSVSATVSSTDAGSWMPDGLPSTASICTELDGGRKASSSSTVRVRERELLVGLLVHEVRLVAVVVEVLDVLHLGVHARELLAGAERPVDDGARLEVFSFVRTKAPPLPGFTCWNSTMRQTRAVDLDVHPVLELVRVDDLGHGAPQCSLADGRRSSFVNCVSTLAAVVGDDDEVLDPDARPSSGR